MLLSAKRRSGLWATPLQRAYFTLVRDEVADPPKLDVTEMLVGIGFVITCRTVYCLSVGSNVIVTSGCPGI